LFNKRISKSRLNIQNIQRQYKKKRQKAFRKSFNIPVSKTSRIVSQNHYVPQWYQKRFLEKGIHHFYYIDLYPEIGIKPNREVYKKRECLRLGPLRCFKQEHLYTLELFNHKSDVIEKELFEKIDDNELTPLYVPHAVRELSVFPIVYC